MLKGAWQNIRYEGLNMFYFTCGHMGGSKCPSIAHALKTKDINNGIIHGTRRNIMEVDDRNSHDVSDKHDADDS